MIKVNHCFNMGWVSKTAIYPKIIFISPNILDDPAREKYENRDQGPYKSPGPIQLSTCKHI